MPNKCIHSAEFTNSCEGCERQYWIVTGRRFVQHPEDYAKFRVTLRSDLG